MLPVLGHVSMQQGLLIGRTSSKSCISHVKHSAFNAKHLACTCQVLCRMLSCNLCTSCCRHGYERELMTLLNQLVRDMNRKIERQKERAILESSARPLSAEDKARLDAIKASRSTCLMQHVNRSIHSRAATAAVVFAESIV